MSVSISLLAGAGWQFFDNNGVPLAGGLLYTYAAGTTTPQTTYTTSAGNIANANPVVLDSAGRTPNEIWLTSNLAYKFLLKTSTGTLIASYDDIGGIFNSAALAASSGSSLIGFIQSQANAVAETVQDKLRQTVSVKDFGAVGDGVTNDTTAIQNALSTGKSVYFPSGTYNISSALVPSANQLIYGAGQQNTIIQQTSASANGFTLSAISWVYIQQLSIVSTAVSPTGAAISVTAGGNNFIDAVQTASFFKGFLFTSTGTLTVNNSYTSSNVSHGIHITSSGVASVGIWISNSYSLVNGGNGLLIDGLNSGHYFNTLELSTNSANGFAANVDATGAPSELFCTKIVCDSNLQSGFLIGAGVVQCTFSECWASNRGSGFNFYCEGTNILFIGGRIYNCYGNGMTFLTGSRCSVVGTHIQEAGSNTANTYDGIRSSISGLVVSGVTIFSSLSYTRYGIYLDTGASNTTITGCNLTGNVTGGLYNASSSTSIYISNSIGSGANSTASWTPVIDFQSGVSGSFTYTTQTGNSTRNGNMIFCDFDIAWSASPTAGNVTRISGFPIAINTVTSAVGSIGSVRGITFTPTTGAGTGTMLAVENNDSTHVALSVSASGASFTDSSLNGSGFGGIAGSISGTFSYLAA